MGDDEGESEQDTRISHDPSRHPGSATTSTPARGHDAAVTEDPADSAEITKVGALWIVFPVVCVVVLVIVLLVAVT